MQGLVTSGSIATTAWQRLTILQLPGTLRRRPEPVSRTLLQRLHHAIAVNDALALDGPGSNLGSKLSKTERSANPHSVPEAAPAN